MITAARRLKSMMTSAGVMSSQVVVMTVYHDALERRDIVALVRALECL